MQEFNPYPNLQEFNGKFIMFAQSIAKANAPAAASFLAGGSSGSTWQAAAAPAAPHAKGAFATGGQMKGGAQMKGCPPMGQMGKGSKSMWMPPENPETSFLNYWGLGDDAQNKLWKLSPTVRETVMREFNPKGSQGDVTGKFIMFAASIEKANPGAAVMSSSPWAGGGKASVQAQVTDKGKGKGGPWPSVGGKGRQPQGYDLVSEAEVAGFINYWALNADAQAKLWSLSPEAQRTVIDKFSPDPNMAEVSGKFIMFAASMERPSPGKGKSTATSRHAGFSAEEEYFGSRSASYEAAKSSRGARVISCR